MLFVGPLIPLFRLHLWVSKPEWPAIFALGRGIHVTHSLRFTSGATPANLLTASMTAKHYQLSYASSAIICSICFLSNISLSLLVLVLMPGNLPFFHLWDNYVYVF